MDTEGDAISEFFLNSVRHISFSRLIYFRNDFLVKGQYGHVSFVYLFIIFTIFFSSVSQNTFRLFFSVVCTSRRRQTSSG